MLPKQSCRIFSSIVILFFIVQVFASCAGSAGESLYPLTDNPVNDVVRTITRRVLIPPGDKFHIYFDPESMQLDGSIPIQLPQECEVAVAKVPEWLRENLTLKFHQLSRDHKTIYANLILDSPHDKYVDEIAFCIVHSAVENLQDDYMFPEIFTHNAELIYGNDEYLDYVDILEKDNYTTVVYRDKDNVERELPRDIYYWYIVHPKLSDELPTYVDPDYDVTSQPPFDRNYGVPPPTGKFWRDWLFHSNDTGYPLLSDRLGECGTLWEAISACNGWVGGSMSFTSDQERPCQPVRIYRKHIGRCGEYQDMRNAVARAGLIPSTCTCNSAEDHVWNEFWDGRWIHWDGGVDSPMMYENGWGKRISSVWNTRGDSSIWSVTDKYTPVCRYTASVLDSSGLPVDGALVKVLTENYYNQDLLTTTTWGTTDYTGQVSIELGDMRNYWSSADTDELGDEPTYGSTQVITDSVADENYTHIFQLSRNAPALNVNEIDPPGDVSEKYRMEIDYEVVGNIQGAENSYSGEHGGIYSSSGNVDFFIADSRNQNLYDTGLVFNAYEVTKRGASGNVSFILPDEDTYYTVLSNEFSQASTKIVEITISVHSSIKTEITSPGDGQEFAVDDVIFIEGTAWGPEGIEKVEIDLDGLENWGGASDTAGDGAASFSTWEFYLDTSGAGTGTHVIQARASFANTSFTATLSITLEDKTKPYVAIETPGKGSGFRIGETVTLRGTATDNVGVAHLEMIIDLDHENSTIITSLQPNGSWSYETRDLSLGDHSLTVKATDEASNTFSATRNIRILESIVPEVSIDGPRDGEVFKLGDSVEIWGSASDNMEISRLEIIVDGEGGENIISGLKEDGSWTYSWKTRSVSSSVEEHTIEIRAVDGSDNAASDEVRIVLDGTVPEAAIRTLEERKVFRADDSMGLEGNATDAWGISEVLLLVDNEPFSYITREVRNGKWSYFLDPFDLDSGMHTITVVVTDSVGHSSEAGMEVVIDAEDPLVEFHEIAPPAMIGETVTLGGAASDDLEITEFILYIGREGPFDIMSMLDGEKWEYRWNTSGMPEGTYKVSVVVTDVVGNRISENIRIRLVERTGEEEIEPDGGSGEGSLESVSFGWLGVFSVVLIVILLAAYGVWVKKR